MIDGVSRCLNLSSSRIWGCCTGKRRSAAASPAACTATSAGARRPALGRAGHDGSAASGVATELAGRAVPHLVVRVARVHLHRQCRRPRRRGVVTDPAARCPVQHLASRVARDPPPRRPPLGGGGTPGPEAPLLPSPSMQARPPPPNAAGNE
jgi:hypothetical protein